MICDTLSFFSCENIFVSLVFGYQGQKAMKNFKEYTFGLVISHEHCSLHSLYHILSHYIYGVQPQYHKSLWSSETKKCMS